MDELKKYEVIKGLCDHPETANKDRAALELGCTKRHINRMIKGYKEQGKAYFRHGNTGKKPVTAVSDARKAEIVLLYENKYYGANFRHFTELLDEHENIQLSRSTVAGILESRYILSPRVTRAKHKRFKRELKEKKNAATVQREKDRIQCNLVAVENIHSRRPRCAYFGELQQMDATLYEWIPGQVWHFHLAIDDASGRITIRSLPTEETYLRIRKKMPRQMTKTPIPSSHMPVSSSEWNLSPAAFHRPMGEYSGRFPLFRNSGSAAPEYSNGGFMSALALAIYAELQVWNIIKAGRRKAKKLIFFCFWCKKAKSQNTIVL